jgi:hypothetical protein
LIIVGGVLLIAGGILGSLFTGGALAASAAGVAIIAGVTGAGGPAPRDGA